MSAHCKMPYAGLRMVTSMSNVSTALLAGVVVVAVVATACGRAQLSEDAGPAPAREMMSVGAGTIDFKTILAKGRKMGLKHWYIEHDEPKDAMASITASAAAMKKL